MSRVFSKLVGTSLKKSQREVHEPLFLVGLIFGDQVSRSEGLLSYFAHRVSNGKSEGIHNKIKTLKRQAYGYRDMEYFKLRLYHLYEQRRQLTGWTYTILYICVNFLLEANIKTFLILPQVCHHSRSEYSKETHVKQPKLWKNLYIKILRTRKNRVIYSRWSELLNFQSIKAFNGNAAMNDQLPELPNVIFGQAFDRCVIDIYHPLCQWFPQDLITLYYPLRQVFP